MEAWDQSLCGLKGLVITPWRYTGKRICLPPPPTRLNRKSSNRLTYPSPSPHRSYKRYRNINLFPIDYAFRPRLRGRLTLSRLPLLRKPWVFGVRVSHPHLRYSCQHNLLWFLQPSSRSTFSGCHNAPLPLTSFDVNPQLRCRA